MLFVTNSKDYSIKVYKATITENSHILVNSQVVREVINCNPDCLKLIATDEKDLHATDLKELLAIDQNELPTTDLKDLVPTDLQEQLATDK